MKLIFKIHSFSELITNSSSEIFVCKTDKKEEVVTEILRTLVDLYNKQLDFKHPNDEFVFKEKFKFEDLQYYIEDDELRISYDESSRLPYELTNLITSFFGGGFYRDE